MVLTSEAGSPSPDFSPRKEVEKKPVVAVHMKSGPKDKGDKDVKALLPELGKLQISKQEKAVGVQGVKEGEVKIRDLGTLRGRGNHGDGNEGRARVDRNEESKVLEKVKKQLRSVLIPHKNGLMLDSVNKEYREMVSNASLKGEVRRFFFLFVQSFYRPKTETSFNRQFSPKSPKIGKKSGQRVQNSQNKDSTVNSVLRPTVGIHQFCPSSYCGNPFIYSSGFPQ